MNDMLLWKQAEGLKYGSSKIKGQLQKVRARGERALLSNINIASAIKPMQCVVCVYTLKLHICTERSSAIHAPCCREFIKRKVVHVLGHRELEQSNRVVVDQAFLKDCFAIFHIVQKPLYVYQDFIFDNKYTQT